MALALILPGWTSAARAQSSGGGHDPGLAWSTIESAHFAVHAPRAHEALARRVIAICEEMYPELCRSFDYHPPRTDVVLHTERDDANGFMTIIPLRMELYIAEPRLALRNDRDTNLRQLVVHEFTHVLQTKQAGLSRWTAPFLGELNAFWMALAPGWFLEGLPTLNETRFSAGGRGRNPSHYMKMMAPVAEGEPWVFDNLSRLSRKRQPYDTEYVAGYFMADRIARLGEAAHASGPDSADVWRRILERFYSRPYLGISHAVRAETGRSPEKIYNELLEDFFRECCLGAAGDSLARAPRDLLRWGGATVWRESEFPEHQQSPRWIGPDSLAFHVYAWDEQPGVVVMDRRGKSRRLLERYLNEANDGFAIDSRRVIWPELVPHLRWSTRMQSRLFLLDRRTGERRRIGGAARLSSPDLSPSGDRVAAVEHTAEGYRLVWIDLPAGAMHPLLAIEGEACFHPRWSPDGTKIAFVRKDARGWLDIALADAATGEWRTLGPADVYTDESPGWMPDGKHVLFSSARGGTFSIWAVEVETGKRALVSIEPLGAFSPDVSPDGRELAISRYADGGYRVVTLPIDPAQWIPEEEVMLEDNPFLFQNEAPLRATETLPATSHSPIEIPKDEGRSNAIALADPVSDLAAARAHPYHGTARMLVPRGWIPFPYEDENGLSPALCLVSADPLQIHRWYGYLGISPRGAPATFDVRYQLDAWWPRITFGAYSIPDRVGSGEDESWWRARGASLGVSLPLTLERNVYAAGFQPYAAIVGENEEASAGPLRPARSRYRGYRVGASFSRLSRTIRDLFTTRGLSLRAFHERSVGSWGSEYEGHRTNARATLTLPSPLRRHDALAFTTTYEFEKGEYDYSSSGAVPLGHSSGGRNHKLRWTTAYHFPIAYIEWTTPLLPVYFDALSGRIFHDWGVSWDRGALGDAIDANASYAIGAGLHLEGDVIVPASIDGVAYYQAAGREWGFDVSVGLPLPF